MFDSNNVKHYLLAITLVLIASYVGNNFKNYYIDDSKQEYDMIKLYLLNDSPLYGQNKPKIWIHSKYELNARKWRDFQSRNTNDLNQPYISLTIQSIIDHCSQDFHICLIDDQTFSKLIPGWNIDLSNVPIPMKNFIREIAMLNLLDVYGGIVVPDSFVCTKNLLPLYNNYILNDTPFIFESINRTNSLNSQKKPLFIPNTYFMGSSKNNPTIQLIIDKFKSINYSGHVHNEMYFTGEHNTFISYLIDSNKLILLDGKLIGIKTNDNKTILVEDLLEEKYLDIYPQSYGVYIPKDEILVRNKYQWFAVMSKKELFDSKLAIVNYLKTSKIDSDEKLLQSFSSNSSVSKL